MKQIAILGGNKKFNSYLAKILDTTGVQASFITRYMVTKQNVYDYIVFNRNCNIKNVEINGSYCLVNMDLIKRENSNVNIYGNIITYGLGNKNTVTVSSMENEDEFVYCLQRDVNYNALGKLEAREIPVSLSFKCDDELYASIVGITISLIEEKSISRLTKVKKLPVLN